METLFNARTLLGFALFFACFHSAGRAETYIRYNIAGYYTHQSKRVVVMSDENRAGADWIVTRRATGQEVARGVIDGAAIPKGDFLPLDFNHEIVFSSLREAGAYVFTLSTGQSVEFTIAADPYKDIVFDVLKAVRARRSGSPDAIVHGLSHTGDAACDVYRRNGSDNALSNWKKSPDGLKADMLGGYYDAGDYIKFTQNNAYLIYQLCRAYEANPALFDGVKRHSASAYDDMLDELRFGLDYLLKTQPDPATFIIQVADASDHAVWPMRLPENDPLNGKRKSYALNSKSQMGMTAAALALGAKIFEARGGADTALGQAYRAKAISIYAAAKASQEPVGWVQFYPDKNADDNMKLAAIELHHLTKASGYLNDARAITYRSYWASWSEVDLYANIRSAGYSSQDKHLATGPLNHFQNHARRADNIWGVPTKSTWGTLFIYMAIANAALGLEEAAGDAAYRQMAIDVLDYAFGLNSWGKGFVATQRLPGSVREVYAVMYRLQPDIFPTGEIAEGPTNKTTHDAHTAKFYPPHDPKLPDARFNTDAFCFFEQKGDYVCMETTIGGLGNGVLLLSLAHKFLAEPASALGFEGWRRTLLSAEELADGTELGSVRDTVPFDAEAARFLRLRTGFE